MKRRLPKNNVFIFLPLVFILLGLFSTFSKGANLPSGIKSLAIEAGILFPESSVGSATPSPPVTLASDEEKVVTSVENREKKSTIPNYIQDCTTANAQVIETSVVCVGCHYSDPDFSVDSNPNNYTRLSLNAGQVDSSISQILIF